MRGATRNAPYGRCGACRKPVDPHGTDCVYCGADYAEAWADAQGDEGIRRAKEGKEERQ